MDDKKSAFQTPVPIGEVISSIHRKEYLLPAIQREFVWSPEQVVRLFDSLMRDYTISSFLFWKVRKEKIRDFQFYEFIRDYHKRDNSRNPKANVSGEDDITSILDGQQRLTALYIGLRGTYAYKMPWKRRSSDHAYPTRKLYLNLLSKSKEFDLMYDFRLLTDDEASLSNENTHWFEAGKILEFESLRDINKHLRDNNLFDSEFAEECLCKLYDVIKEDRAINYYMETSQNLDKVLNIFIRVNSGGTPLSYSDLLLSIATAQWQTRDAREEIADLVEEINEIGGGFEFDKDFVLKSCLVLADIGNIAFIVDNFNISNTKKIEDSWEDIVKAIRLSVELISSFGYNWKTLPSNNAVIPIAYFILRLGNPTGIIESQRYTEDRSKIRRWFTYSLIKRSFSGQPDNVLRPIRKIIKDSQDVFPLDGIIDRFKGTNRSLTFGEEEIENLLLLRYGKKHTFSVLSLLYPTLDFKNRFHQDHIYPRSLFRRRELTKRGIPDERMEFYLDNHDNIGNLQLLEGLPNEEKSNKDFETWLLDTYPGSEERREYMKKNYIPRDIDLGFGNFEEFFEKREELLSERLRELLG